MRELAMMADGRGRLEWDQTSWVLSMLYNCNRGKDSKAATPSDFNPYAVKTKRTVIRMPLSAIAPMLVGKKNG